MAVLPHEGTYSIMYFAWPIPVGSHYHNGYIARPDKAGRFPTVILSPDITGITAHEKHVARRLARRGVAVVAVDFYERLPSTEEEALTFYGSLGDRDGIRSIDEAYDFLASDDIDWAHTSKVGVLGLDVGGRLALIAAAHREWVGAAAVAYTPLTGDEERTFQVASMLDHLPVPVLGLYGGDDDLIASETVDEAQTRNATGSWLLYEGAGHGFMDEVGPNYHETATEDALIRLAEFFTANLPKAEVEELG